MLGFIFAARIHANAVWPDKVHKRNLKFSIEVKVSECLE